MALYCHRLEWSVFPSTCYSGLFDNLRQYSIAFFRLVCGIQMHTKYELKKYVKIIMVYISLSGLYIWQFHYEKGSAKWYFNASINFRKYFKYKYFIYFCFINEN